MVGLIPNKQVKNILSKKINKKMITSLCSVINKMPSLGKIHFKTLWKWRDFLYYVSYKKNRIPLILLQLMA